MTTMRLLPYVRYVSVLLIAAALFASCNLEESPDDATSRSIERHNRSVSAAADDQFQIDLGDARVPLTAPDANTVALCFCVDVSTSMDRNVGGQKKNRISKKALRRTIDLLDDYARKHPEKRILVSVVDFGGKARLVRKLEPLNKDSLHRVIDEELETREGTALGDAMVLGVRELVGSGAATRGIIALTDGQNNRGPAPASVMRSIRKNAVKPEAVISGINVWLVAFDVKASLYDPVKAAGATVVESTDQASLEKMMLMAVQRVLAEDPRNL
jgi:hypothetical protein